MLTRTEIATVRVPVLGGTIDVNLRAGETTFLVGGNGTGKSALVHMIAASLLTRPEVKLVYLPGSRPSYFDGESLTMTPNTRQAYETNSRSWDLSPDTRIRPISGTSANERAIFDLQAAEIQYKVNAANDVETHGVNAAAIHELPTKNSPLDRVNRIIRQANLPVKLVIDGAEIRAQRDDAIYSISKMSDGERTALVLIANIVAAKPGSVFLIDEPELHMHPSIVVPLVSASIAGRPDCSFIACTHELSLPKAISKSTVIVVRGCTWSGTAVQNWDITVLPGTSAIPEDVRGDIIGSRQKMLFVEGTSTSLDHQLYALLFPRISVCCRESCVDVRRAVEGIRSVEASHNVMAYGIVDNDGMDRSFVEKFMLDGVYALPMFSVESIYYSPELLEAVATRHAATLGADKSALLATATRIALESLKPANIQHMAVRVAERQVRDNLLLNMPSRSDIMSGSDKIEVTLVQPYQDRFTEIETLLSAGNLDALISRFPVRETGVLDQLAKGLRFVGTEDYEQAALAAVNASESLRNLLRAKLGALSSELA